MRAAVGGHTSRPQPRGSRDLARELEVARQIGVAANLPKHAGFTADRAVVILSGV